METKYKRGCHPNSRKGSFKKGHKTNIGRVLSRKTRLKISIKRTGQKVSKVAIAKMKKVVRRKGWHHTDKTRRRLSRVHKKRVQMGLHNSYKGGVTKINTKIRHSLRYRLWREKVYKRDKYTCTECKAKNGNGKRIVLQADHIKPFSEYPKLRFVVKNGRTLCVPCHKRTETYGRNLLIKRK